VEYRQLASTPVKVSRIGFGCGPASGYDYGKVDEAEWYLAVQAALDNGINFFDVADVYGFGHAEEMLSDALGNRRHEVVVATKCGLAWDEHGHVRRDLSRQHILKSVDASLRRLRLDVIPLYQIHWPDRITPIEETLGILNECQGQGKIRHFGVCNFSSDLLKHAHAIHPFQSEQIGFNLLCREAEKEILPWCSTQGVSVLAHSGLARGFLSGRYIPGDGSTLADTRRASPYFSKEGRIEKQKLLDEIRQIAVQNGKAFSSVAIRWILDHRDISVVLVGIKSRKQLAENLHALDWHLSSAEWKDLDELSSKCPAGQAGEPAHKQ